MTWEKRVLAYFPKGLEQLILSVVSSPANWEILEKLGRGN
jgi:hypothetical protein